MWLSSSKSDCQKIVLRARKNDLKKYITELFDSNAMGVDMTYTKTDVNSAGGIIVAITIVYIVRDHREADWLLRNELIEDPESPPHERQVSHMTPLYEYVHLQDLQSSHGSISFQFHNDVTLEHVTTIRPPLYSSQAVLSTGLRFRGLTAMSMESNDHFWANGKDSCDLILCSIFSMKRTRQNQIKCSK